MSFTEHAQMVFESEGRYADYLSLGTERRSHQTVMVFDGPDGLETVIRFTELTVGRNSVVFYSRTRGRSSQRVQTGSIEGQQDVVDFLTEAVEEHEQLQYDVVVDR